MFFRSDKATLLGIVLIVVGGFMAVLGWTYADAAKRETTTVGTISRVACGRSCTYTYQFTVNQVRIQDDTSTCRTWLTPQHCKVGASVLVYYDPQNVSQSMLEDFGAASRERSFMGIWMVVCGVLLIGLYSILNRNRRNDADEPDESYEPVKTDDGPEDLHITPGH